MPAGNSILFKLEQYANAAFSMLVNPVGSSISVKLEQS